jgi:PRTRC genetic system protein A
MIPLYVKTADFQTPSDGVYYLVAANGAFLVKKTPLFDSITRVDDVVPLQTERSAVRLHFPKLPRWLLEQLLGFFTRVYRMWDGEAIALLYYSPDLEQFRIEVPPQTLQRYRTSSGWRTESKVQYGSVSRAEGFLKLGDAHSHPESPAFFSSTDERDDEEDGLRMVIGRLNRDAPEVCVSFVANGTRFTLDPADVFADHARAFRLAPPPDEWMRRVKCCFETTEKRIIGSDWERRE